MCNFVLAGFKPLERALIFLR